MDILLKHPKYRPDIDGLRAIAVLSVVLYHLFPTIFQGGFIGVDIFFIISGYLISIILFDNFENNSFSYVEFYTRRILRIFPALILVLLTTLVFGWFFLSNDDFALLGKHVAGGTGFISNFILTSEAGYFDNTAISKPLLHLWSLGVEEQFYIFWPIIIGLFYKFRKNFLLIVSVIAIASFIFNISTITTLPTIAFYSPFSRVWELMIGGILAYILLHKPQIISKKHNIKSILGLTLIIAGFILLNDRRDFPGYWALMPCFGTFFVISARDSWINRNVLSSKPFVAIGLISYPLYLWHWPLISLASISIYSNHVLSVGLKIILFVVSILLSWATYQFIEKPIRINNNYRGTMAVVLSIIVCFIGCSGYLIYKKQGFPLRFGDKGDYLAYFEGGSYFSKYGKKYNIFDSYRENCNFYDVKQALAGKATIKPRVQIGEECYTKTKGLTKSIFIWGDSHAQALYPGLKSELSKKVSILQVTSSGCHPDIIETAPDGNNFCITSNYFALKTIKKENPNVVILAQYTGHDINKTREIVEKLKQIGVAHVIVIGPDPSWEPTTLHKVIATKYWINTPDRISTDLNQSVMNEESNMQKNIKESDDFQYVSLIHFFCNKQGCLAYLNNDKKDGITTYDYGHLSPIASRYLAKNLLVPIISNDLK